MKEDIAQPTRAQQLLQTISKRDTAFHDSPHSGDRAPNVLFLDEKGAPHSLVDYLIGTKHTLLLFAGLSERRPSQPLYQLQEMIAQRYSDTVRPILVTTTALPASDWTGEILVNTDRAIHRRYGATEESLYLIRPDQHIGYRSRPVVKDLFSAYLAQILL